MGAIRAQDRYQMGAREIPRVVGKWPGNIDVLFKMMKAFKTSYILDVYLQLFEEYQCTTLNTRILWSDMVRHLYSLLAPLLFMSALMCPVPAFYHDVY